MDQLHRDVNILESYALKFTKVQYLVFWSMDCDLPEKTSTIVNSLTRGRTCMLPLGAPKLECFTSTIAVQTKSFYTWKRQRVLMMSALFSLRDNTQKRPHRALRAGTACV